MKEVIKTENIKTYRTQGMSLWMLVVFGLVLINVSCFFIESVSLEAIVSFSVNLLAPRCWPVWYSWILWLLVFGFGLSAILTKYERKRGSRFAVWLTTVGVGCIFFFSSFVCRALRIKAYYIFAWGMDFPYTHFYKPLIYAPMTELSATGTLSWKLLILPTLCLAGFWGLLRFAKTKKQHSLREVEKCNGK